MQRSGELGAVRSAAGVSPPVPIPSFAGHRAPLCSRLAGSPAPEEHQASRTEPRVKAPCAAWQKPALEHWCCWLTGLGTGLCSEHGF